ncbi:hypothetical protein, partial [Anaplasma marginale]
MSTTTRSNAYGFIGTIWFLSGPVDTKLTGTPTNSSSLLMYDTAFSGRSLRDTAPNVLVRHPGKVSYTGSSLFCMW